jgi:hypothetical protein
VCPQEIVFEVERAQADTRAILGEMVAQFVTFSHERAHQRLVVLGPFRDQEERCSCAMLAQLCHDQRR